MDLARHASLLSRAPSGGRGLLFIGGAIFALGLVTGATVGPSLAPAIVQPSPSLQPITARRGGEQPQFGAPGSAALARGMAYPAEVLRVIDGDTFEARVRVWPGLDVNTKVRLRGIDAPELHARCGDELVKAQAARGALETILAEGDVVIAQVGVDKYGGRVDAVTSTRTTADVSAALLSGGWARAYDGGRRGSWCG